MKLPRSRQDCNGRDLELTGRLPALQQLVQGMLSRNPASRLSAPELVQQVRSKLLNLKFGGKSGTQQYMTYHMYAVI